MLVRMSTDVRASIRHLGGVLLSLGATAVIAVGLLAAPASAPAARDSRLSAVLLTHARPTHVPHPADNPATPAKVALGQRLFFDTRLSGNNSISCATCHVPEQGFEDGRRLSTGVGGKPLARHTPTILNLAWADSFFWDGRAASLEEQALGPIEAEAEMAQPVAGLVEELRREPAYVAAFGQVFGSRGIGRDTIAEALAAFEREQVSKRSPFDLWVAGDERAVSSAAKRGFQLFVGKARCSACHSGWSFTDGSFHDIGLTTTDPGRYAQLPLPTMRHAFKTPTLRDVAERAPYMHNGSLETLEAVIDHYSEGFVRRPSLSAEMTPLRLSTTERSELIAFLRTLSGSLAPGAQVASHASHPVRKNSK
jgi:cytochrome c peroxidase